jgi:hypothetical protein
MDSRLRGNDKEKENDKEKGNDREKGRMTTQREFKE